MKVSSNRRKRKLAERAGLTSALGLRAATLRQLREESRISQEDLSQEAEITQSALSRIERRESNPVSALRGYVEAMGGELEMVAVFGNERVSLLRV